MVLSASAFRAECSIEVTIDSQNPAKVFCAYPFTKPKQEFYEELKLLLPHQLLDLYLPHRDYQPAMIWSRIEPEINSSDVCLIDLEHANPNVAFECGYAISKRIHPILVRHFDSQEPILPCLQAFQYLQYYRRHDLVERITEFISNPDWQARLPNPMDGIAGVSPGTYPSLAPHTEIYLLAVRARQDTVHQLARELRRRPYTVHSDAIEQASRVATRDIVKSLLRFNNIAVHLVGESRSNREELMTLNSVASFFAGIAHGLGKELRVFQQLPTPKHILDMESILVRYTTEAEIVAAARAWKDELSASASEFEERQRVASTTLAPLGTQELPADLGNPWAERDWLLNENTYSVTSRTSRIRNGEGILYVGPRGCGKTADFINLTTQQESSSSRLTVSVKLSHADIISLRGIGQEMFADIDRRNIYRHVWRLAIIGLLVDEYRRLHEELPDLEPVPALDDATKTLMTFFGDFEGCELAEMVDHMITTINAQEGTFRNSQELIRHLAFPAGYPILAQALSAFDIRIAIDGLDQGWDPGMREAVELLAALIDEAHSLEQRYRPQLKISIFALEEVYRDVSATDRDSDKRSVERYSWDRDQLADMIGARILEVTAGRQYEEDPRNAWSMLFDGSINGSDTFDYVVERSLMRPRHLLRFCREALIRANNRRHLKVSADDILESEEQFSSQMIDDLSLEYEDRYPGIGDVILEFLEIDETISFEDFREQINRIFAARDVPDAVTSWLRRDDRNRVLVALKALYSVGFIGVIRDGRRIYSYDQDDFYRIWPRERRIRPRRRRRSRRRSDPRSKLRYPSLVIHPAFHRGLAIQT